MKKLFYVLAAIFFIAACGTDEPDDLNKAELNYFPLEPGSWYVYRVDSIDYLTRPYDTIRFWIREAIRPEVNSIDGNEYNQIHVFKKYNWQDDWERIRTDYARVDEEGAYRYAENIFYIKQTYPPAINVEWNSTPYNDVSELYDNQIDFDETYYVGVNDYRILGESGYDSTLNVELFSQYDLINRIDFRERYANHIGLYRKFELNAEYQPIDPEETDSTINMEPNSGYKYTQTLVDYFINN
ncbi:MAG: hypothetical protein ACPGLV_09810 [Bacteroidia bacterium]